MAGEEAHPGDAHPAHHAEELGEGGEARLVLAVGVDVLAEEGDLHHPRLLQELNLLKDEVGVAGDLGAAGGGDDAVGAVVVAPRMMVTWAESAPLGGGGM